MFRKRARAIAQELLAREQAEQQLLDVCKELSASSPDPAVRFFLELILEDEQRHAHLLSLVANGQPGGPVDATTELPPAVGPAADSAALDSINLILALEQSGLRELRQLRRSVTPREFSSVGIVLDLMMADTRKHVTLLQHIKRSLSQGLAPASDWDVMAYLDRHGRLGEPRDEVIKDNAFRTVLGLPPLPE